MAAGALYFTRLGLAAPIGAVLADNRIRQDGGTIRAGRRD